MEISKRFWEIDFLRGTAVVMMIIFHFVFDLNYFGGYGMDLQSGFWFFFARLTASIFILLVGISLALSYSRSRKSFMRYLPRGLKIFTWGILITLATWVFMGKGVIVFGVLHFIGISIILAYPFLRYSFKNLILGIAVIATGLCIQNIKLDFPWLIWLGLAPLEFYTFDYFPLLPWFGLILVGLCIGNILYPDYKPKIKIYDLSNFPVIRQFRFLGRHSLLIYLLHQPVLILILYSFVL